MCMTARLRVTLQHLSEHNLELNRGKCSFGQSSIEFLCYIISGEGILPTTDNVQGIKAITLPENTSNVASFLGMTNYYAKFLADYAELTEPLW